MNEMPKCTRKHGKHIRVPVLPDEEAIIKANAEASGLSTASFIRKVAMGYQVESIVDIKQVSELSRVNGDLGRLGGLLKLWLANDPRTANFSPSLIKTLLNKIESTQQELMNIMEKILDR
ncbi:conjugal transfer transcriptional regulator TraJ [Cronobacter turicensis]